MNNEDIVKVTILACADICKVIASYPLEDFDHDKRPDEQILFGANNWALTVGDVKAARRAVYGTEAYNGYNRDFDIRKRTKGVFNDSKPNFTEAVVEKE